MRTMGAIQTSELKISGCSFGVINPIVGAMLVVVVVVVVRPYALGASRTCSSSSPFRMSRRGETWKNMEQSECKIVPRQASQPRARAKGEKTSKSKAQTARLKQRGRGWGPHQIRQRAACSKGRRDLNGKASGLFVSLFQTGG